MGEYFRAVCHSCRSRLELEAGRKLREIRHNSHSCRILGLWMTSHAGHRLELRGDEYNSLCDYDHNEVAEYVREWITLEDSCMEATPTPTAKEDK